MNFTPDVLLKTGKVFWPSIPLSDGELLFKRKSLAFFYSFAIIRIIFFPAVVPVGAKPNPYLFLPGCCFI